jgi:hypothetical protein
MLMVVYRHFGDSLIGPIFTAQAVPEEFCPEKSVNTNTRSVTSQKSEGLIYTMAKA